jgi:hypothetical protein
MAEQTAPTNRIDQARTDMTNTAKKAYHCPQFTSLGTVEQLTLSGASAAAEGGFGSL